MVLESCIPVTGLEEQEFFARYQEAVNQVRSKWGDPAYEGFGPDRNLPYCNDLPYYNRANRLAWWPMDDSVAVVMVTDHDAMSLFCLTLAVVVRPAVT